MASGGCSGRSYQHSPHSNMDHRHRQGFRTQAVAWATHFNTAPSSSTAHRHQHGHRPYQGHHGPQWQHGPQASTWLQMVTQATYTNIPISPGSKAQGYHQGFSQQHRLYMSICISGFITAWAVAWATDTNMASSDITDHSGPSRRSNPKNELFFILGLHHCPDPG